MSKTSNVQDLKQTSTFETVNTLWIREDDRIEIPASEEADSVPITSIDTLNWYNYTSRYLKATNILVNLKNPENGRFSLDETENNYGDLLIQPVERKDSGHYLCEVVKNDLYTLSITYLLDVYYMDPPTITPPFTQGTGKNSNTTFFCGWTAINPDKQPNITWILDGSELNTSGTRYSVGEGKQQKSLIILNPSQSDVGSYSCRIDVKTNRGYRCSETGISSTFLIVTAIATFILGSLQTCLIICRYIQKRNEGSFISRIVRRTDHNTNQRIYRDYIQN